MTNGTIIGNYVEPERIRTANERLRAYCARHNIDTRYLPADADAVDILIEIWSQSEAYDWFPKRTYYGALAVFRRAIGSKRATHLHWDNSQPIRRAYAAW
jgi:hypothetical protein